MKTKYVLIYAGLGVAFLAVSLWVLLSGGRSAKAIRAKYRLGGAMLAAWAMLSAASCDVFGPVTCYDPVMPDPVTYTVQGKSELVVSSGDIILATLEKRYIYDWYARLEIVIRQGPEILQRFELDNPLEDNNNTAVYALTVDLPSGVQGGATLELLGINLTDNGSERSERLASQIITLR